MNLLSCPLRKTASVVTLIAAVSLGVSMGHAQDLPSGRWRLLPAPRCPSPANQTFLNAAAWLPKAQVGFAVGACRQDPARYWPLVYRVTPQSGGTPMPIHGLKQPFPDTTLNAVSADSPTDIWVAGYSNTSSQAVVNIQRSKGGAFHPIACPNPGSNQNIAYGVLAFAPDNVFIAGSYDGSVGQGYVAQTYLAHWDGNSCSQIPSPNPSSFYNAFFAIGGSSPHDIWLVGDYADSVFIPLCIHYDGTDFKQYKCPLGASGGSYINQLVSVSAVAEGSAWAVGYETNYGMFWGLDEYFANDSWQLPEGSTGTCFTDVYRAWGVVGVNLNFAWQVAECQGTTLIGFWNGQWNPFPGPQMPPRTNYNVLMGVSASDTHTALAAGGYKIGEGPQLPFITLYSDSNAPAPTGSDH